MSFDENAKLFQEKQIENIKHCTDNGHKSQSAKCNNNNNKIINKGKRTDTIYFYGI